MLFFHFSDFPLTPGKRTNLEPLDNNSPDDPKSESKKSKSKTDECAVDINPQEKLTDVCAIVGKSSNRCKSKAKGKRTKLEPLDNNKDDNNSPDDPKSKSKMSKSKTDECAVNTNPREKLTDVCAIPSSPPRITSNRSKSQAKGKRTKQKDLRIPLAELQEEMDFPDYISQLPPTPKPAVRPVYVSYPNSEPSIWGPLDKGMSNLSAETETKDSAKIRKEIEQEAMDPLSLILGQQINMFATMDKEKASSKRKHSELQDSRKRQRIDFFVWLYDCMVIVYIVIKLCI